MNEYPHKGTVRGGAVSLGAVNVDAGAVEAIQDVPGDFQRPGVEDVDREAQVEPGRPQPDQAELVAHNLDVVQEAAVLEHLSPRRPLHYVEAAAVGEAHLVVRHDDLVDHISLAHGLHPDGSVHVLEKAVRHAYVLAGSQQADARRVHGLALAIGYAVEIPVHVGEPERESREVHVAHALAVDQVGVPGRLDVGAVWIGAARQTHVETPPIALLCEPELALRVIEVVGFVLKRVAVELDDLVAPHAAPSPPETQPLLRGVDEGDSHRVGAPHDPAVFRPQDGVLVVLGRLREVLGVDAQVELPGAFLREDVERPSGRVVPVPPFALDVVGIGDLPVGRARQRNPGYLAPPADEPHAPRREVQVGIPYLPRFGDVLVVGPSLPAAHRLRAAYHGLAPSPRGVARQPDRFRGSARFLYGQRAAIDRAALEHIGVNSPTGGGLPRGLGVPRMMLPGRTH